MARVALICAASLALVATGCNLLRPKSYRATARVLAASAPKGGAPVDVAKECAAAEAVAKAYLAVNPSSDVVGFSVESVMSTRFIEISVRSDNAKTAAHVCNRIAEAYVGASMKGITRTIVDLAAVPTTPSR